MPPSDVSMDEGKGPRLARAAVAVASAVAAALVAVALLAAVSLRARDAAVRDGILARTGHLLEGELREGGPDEAAAVLSAFGEANRGALRGIAVTSASGTLARWGAAEGVPFEMPAMLGPAWRGLGSRPGMGGRGGHAPFTLRLYPAPGAGGAGRLPALLVAGAVVAGIGLVAATLLAARGLAERERAQRLEAERRRLDALALAGAGLAHRIRNPLAAIKGTAQLMAARPEGGERAARIVEASARIEDLVTQLLRFARPPAPEPEPFDLAQAAREAAARAPGAALVSAPAPVPVRADAGHVADVLDELLANARAHDPEGTLELAVGEARGEAFAEVRDRGTGLAVDAEEAFTPYVTSRPAGTGLGLPTVRALAHANGGEVTLAARAGGGCAARLTLPRSG